MVSNNNYKLFLKCILSNCNYSLINNLSQSNGKSNYILLDSKLIYFVSLHFRFSSLFYSTQLIDIFSYEILNSSFNKSFPLNKSNQLITVYNFNLLNTQDKFFIFIKNLSLLNNTNTTFFKKVNLTSSVTELFFSANWLERECSELHGASFLGKKDLRNLMLQYGDSSVPFQKSFPSIGLKEMYYNPIKDTIIQNPVTLQI